MQRRNQRDPLHQKKSLSQIFLKVEWPVKRMVALLADLAVKRVIEIGPGGGVLTRALLGEGYQVTAVEKDPRFAEHLRSQTELWESVTPGKLTVVNEDILRCNLDELLVGGAGNTALVGNIPYHISSQIIQLGIEHVLKFQAILVMTQLEFAARVAAKPSTKDFGSLTVFAQLRAKVTMEFEVPRTCFEPVPKVDSAVMMIRPREAQLDTDILARTEKLTRVAFSQRRKKLSNSIQTLTDGQEMASCPIDLNRRADSLAPEEFVELAEWVASLSV